MSPQDEAAVKMVKNHLERLGEHWDSVHIFVTKYDPETKSTIDYNIGGGNWYARNGQIREYLTRCDEETREEIRDLNDKGRGGEED